VICRIKVLVALGDLDSFEALLQDEIAGAGLEGPRREGEGVLQVHTAGGIKANF
jgi:hypothetical protein